MLKTLLTWLRGYLLVYIKGYSPERFFNLCNGHDIKLWDIRKLEHGYAFHISLKDYLTLRPIVRKTKTIPYIKKKIGFIFHFKRYIKHKAFFIGAFMAAVLVYIMSLYIWDIDINGQYTHTEEAILEFLESADIYAGVLKKQVNCQEIEDMIRKKYTDIGWVSAEIRGTRLLIQLTETNMPKPYVKQTEPCHIIANKDGIILSMVTRTGTPMVKVGDTVKKGDILVSGVVSIVGDNEILVRKVGVIADADIMIKSFYEYKDKFSLNYEERVYTGNEKQFYSATIFGKRIDIKNPFANYEGFRMFEQLKDDTAFRVNNFYLPFKLTNTVYMEYYKELKTYTKEQALVLAQEHLNDYLKELMHRGVNILDNQVTFKVVNNHMLAMGKIIIEEPVTDTRLVKSDETYVEPPPTEEGEEMVE